MLRLVLARYRAAYAGLPREVWLLAFALFVNRSGTMVMTFMTLYLTSQLGMSEAGAGRMISVYGLGAVTGAFLGGRLSRRLGSIRLQTICLFLSIPGYLVLPLWHSWPPLALSLFGLSLFSEAVRPANAVAITNFTTASNRTRAFALNRLAANLGFSFGPVIGGVLATIHFGLLFVVDAATTLLAAMLLLYFFRLRRTERATADCDAEVLQVSPLKDGPFVVFLLLMLASVSFFFQFGSTYPLYLRDHYRLSKPLIGLMFAVNTTVIVALEMLLIDAIKQWSVLRTIGVGCFLFCLGFAILPFGSSGYFCVFAMLVVTLGEMLSFTFSASFAANRSTPGNEGPYMGWYAMNIAIASVLGPTVGSAIYQVNQDALWISGLLVGATALVGFQFLALRPSAATAKQSGSPDKRARRGRLFRPLPTLLQANPAFPPISGEPSCVSEPTRAPADGR
jgi:predicted MFS family arabinose efflux permease